MKRTSFFSAVLLLAAAASTDSAQAKGGYTVIGATLEIEGLSVSKDIILPEGEDEMFEVALYGDAPEWLAGGTLLTSIYDFGEFGGRQERAGYFDGKDRLFFPGDMRVGPGLWAAGSYMANPELARQLQAILQPRLIPPVTGNAGLLAGNQ